MRRNFGSVVNVVWTALALGSSPMSKAGYGKALCRIERDLSLLSEF